MVEENTQSKGIIMATAPFPKRPKYLRVES